MLIIGRYKIQIIKKKIFAHICHSLCANFKASNTNYHIYCLYFFCKGQVSLLKVVFNSFVQEMIERYWNFHKYKIYTVYVF